MSEQNNKLANIGAALDEKLIQVIRFYDDIRIWVEETHSADDAAERFREFRIMSLELSEYHSAVLDHKLDHLGNEAVVEALEERIKLIDAYDDKIRDVLMPDWDEKSLEEKKNRDAVIDNMTALCVIPVAFDYLVRNGLGAGYISQDQALPIGLAISTTLVCHKTVFSAFFLAAKMACAVPAALNKDTPDNGSRSVFRRIFGKRDPNP